MFACHMQVMDMKISLVPTDIFACRDVRHDTNKFDRCQYVRYISLSYASYMDMKIWLLPTDIFACRVVTQDNHIYRNRLLPRFINVANITPIQQVQLHQNKRDCWGNMYKKRQSYLTFLFYILNISSVLYHGPRFPCC